MKPNALLINGMDNVVTVTQKLDAGSDVIFLEDGKVVSVQTSGVPAYHKIARRDIKAGEDVVKYGQIMAVATCDIRAGEHVHTHNVMSKVQ